MRCRETAELVLAGSGIAATALPDLREISLGGWEGLSPDEVRQRFRLGLLIIEHDIETITRLCPRVVVLNFGRLIAEGSPEHVFNDPEVIRSYTGGDAA